MATTMVNYSNVDINQGRHLEKPKRSGILYISTEGYARPRVSSLDLIPKMADCDAKREGFVKIKWLKLANFYW